MRLGPIGTEGLRIFSVAIPVFALAAKAGPSSVLSFSSLLLHALLPEQPDHIVECFLNVNAVLRGGLNKFATQLFGESRSFLCGHCALDDLVALVAHQHYRNWTGRPRRRVQGRSQVAAARGGSGIRRLLDQLYLVVELVNTRKRGSGRDAVDENEALSIPDPLVPQCGIFFLARGVQHFQHARLLVDHDLLPVRVFNGGIVGLDEVVQTELSFVQSQLKMMVPYPWVAQT